MSATEVKQKIDHLLSQNAQHCDPVRFAYVQGLVKRIQQPSYSHNAALLAKAIDAIEQYESTVTARRAQLRPLLDALRLNYPEQAQQAQDLFEQCQFNRLEKLCKQLTKAQAVEQNSASLSDLNNSINHGHDEMPAPDEELSFEQILNVQEQDVVTTAEARQTRKKATTKVLTSDFTNDAEATQGLAKVVELQSMKVFRESLKHINIDKIIDRAINDEPANPGPHNPHMLAIKSLTQMRELSPEYLRRFASYIETLLWLEKNAAKLSDTKKVS